MDPWQGSDQTGIAFVGGQADGSGISLGPDSSLDSGWQISYVYQIDKCVMPAVKFLVHPFIFIKKFKTWTKLSPVVNEHVASYHINSLKYSLF